jgi:hypothetical protein
MAAGVRPMPRVLRMSRLLKNSCVERSHAHAQSYMISRQGDTIGAMQVIVDTWPFAAMVARYAASGITRKGRGEEGSS